MQGIRYQLCFASGGPIREPLGEYSHQLVATSGDARVRTKIFELFPFAGCNMASEVGGVRPVLLMAIWQARSGLLAGRDFAGTGAQTGRVSAGKAALP